ncbi:MAG: dihydrofolate synthase/folylpolyglutamate synthase [Bacteroidia bacterium]
MTYQETLDFLFTQLPMYQRIGAAAYKKDLSNTIALCSFLHNPEKKIKTIHIAGTNGKGSTSHLLSAVFQTHGYKTGLYTSPHLIDFRERIRINGAVVDKAFVIDFVERIKPVIESHKPSFFEITVAMAFDFFQQQEVDIAIIETGLGGRLDSTNVINPELSIITNIGYDHMDMLGETLELIAAEKAGIIKEGIPVVIGERQPVVVPIFTEIAKNKKSSISFAEDVIVDNVVSNFSSDLGGHYQVLNIRTVLAGLQVLSPTYNFEEKKIQTAFKHVTHLTGLQGRWQVVRNHPKTICDTAHNSDGLYYVMRQLEDETYKDLHIIFGQVAGKEPSKVLALLPKKATYYFCQPSIPRALAVHELSLLALQHGIKGSSHNSVEEAYSVAQMRASDDDVIFVGGSTFVVADFLKFLQELDGSSF